jgi:hypothetical protein
MKDEIRKGRRFGVLHTSALLEFFVVEVFI